MIDEDDFDYDQPVTRIPQNQNAQNKLGKGILQNAEQYLQEMSAGEHTPFNAGITSTCSSRSLF